MYPSGKTKLVTAQSKRKRQARNLRVRRGVYKRVKSLGYDPEPGDLGVGRMKRDESCVEVR